MSKVGQTEWTNTRRVVLVVEPCTGLVRTDTRIIWLLLPAKLSKDYVDSMNSMRASLNRAAS